MSISESRLCLGAHMSTEGGLFRACERAKAAGAEALQIYTRSTKEWRAKPLGPDEIDAFRRALEPNGVRSAFAHSSYLINAGSPDAAQWKRSVALLRDELERAEALGLAYVVMHPGAHVGSGEEAAFARIAEAIDAVHQAIPGAKAQLCLEVTAGQGTNVGYRFSHMREILSRVKEPSRAGICLDTCHLLASGYELRTKEGYEAAVAELDCEVGLAKVRCIHLNDSKKDLGSRVDRHEHIGKGFLGLAAFRFLLNDMRLNDRPMVLETPKEDETAEDMENLRVLRTLVA